MDIYMKSSFYIQKRGWQTDLYARRCDPLRRKISCASSRSLLPLTQYYYYSMSKERIVLDIERDIKSIYVGAQKKVMEQKDLSQ